MATRASIEFDFKQALSQADRVDQIADSLSRLSDNKFEGTMQNLSLNWKGESANRYLAKGERLQGKMNVTANELRRIASDIRRVARNLYNAELAALEIASQRNY